MYKNFVHLTAGWQIFFPALLVVLQAALWQWFQGEELARRNMLFGKRVPPKFVCSPAANAIRGRFRWRIWAFTLVLVIAYCSLPWRNSFRPLYFGTSTSLMFYAQMVVNLLVFGLAHREVSKCAEALPEPSARIAKLYVEQEESSLWLSALDWVAILAPVTIPVGTLFLILAYWKLYPANWHPMRELNFVLSLFAFGAFTCGTYFVLRYRARSNDWDPQPRASRLYRTLLGLIPSTVFTVMIFNGCWQSLTGLKGHPFGNMYTQQRYSMMLLASCFPFIFSVRAYLRRKVSRESSDPMPDYSWKWGFFYYNPGDPAAVVPSRSGISFSYNYANAAVWLFGLIFLLVFLPMLVSSFLA